jgi:hypothetical protein
MMFRLKKSNFKFWFVGVNKYFDSEKKNRWNLNQELGTLAINSHLLIH